MAESISGDRCPRRQSRFSFRDHNGGRLAAMAGAGHGHPPIPPTNAVPAMVKTKYRSRAMMATGNAARPALRRITAQSLNPMSMSVRTTPPLPGPLGSLLGNTQIRSGQFRLGTEPPVARAPGERRRRTPKIRNGPRRLCRGPHGRRRAGESTLAPSFVKARVLHLRAAAVSCDGVPGLGSASAFVQYAPFPGRSSIRLRPAIQASSCS